MLKIAFSGAHGVGKTTLALALAELLSPLARIAVTPEVPRLIASEVENPTFFRRGNNTFGRQLLILARQMEVESAAAADAGARLAICDRTIVDHWAYTRQLFPEDCTTQEGQLWHSLVSRWTRTYALVFSIRPEFPPTDDGTREDDPAFQQVIDAEIHRLHHEAGTELRRISGDIEERLKGCEEVVRRLMEGEDGLVAR